MEEKQSKNLGYELYKAGCEIQSKIKADTEGYGYKYCTLQKLYEVANPILDKYGFFYSQTISSEDGDNYIETNIYHASHRIAVSLLKGKFLIPKVDESNKNVSQEIGRRLTYLRRYSLFVMLGILPEKDTDGADEKKTVKTNDWRNR